MHRYFCLAAVACFLSMQCAGTMVKVRPEYRKMNVEDSRLGIILLSDNMAIANPEDIVHYLGGGDTKQVFSGFFTNQFIECAEQDGNFNEVVIADSDDASGFTTCQEQLSRDEQVHLRVPARKANPEDNPPYLLILDNIDISREINPGKTVVVGGMYGIPTKRKIGELDILKIKGTFALWDNIAGKIAAFGRLNVKFDVLPAMTQNSWIDIIQRISTEIFINQPYGMQSAAP